ncbi:MAG: diaminobutyrate acetyltransferase [Alphaproteobacteria bacterium]|nr:diaminobutyrate acetyltransferase [Alphaproteobacteria bacterium]
MALSLATGAARARPYDHDSTTLREPCAGDGPAIHELIAASPPLDRNSLYCNLLQARDFAATSILAEAADKAGTPLGWISGYVPPTEPQTLFVWQVAVAAAARGQGLGLRMLNALVARPALASLRRLRTTITADNAASWALFEHFARDRGAHLTREPLFLKDRHFAGRHETEHLVTIGPLHGGAR